MQSSTLAQTSGRGGLRRDNLAIKVPATPQGIPAIRELIGEGSSVNVTLLFAQDSYERVAEATLRVWKHMRPAPAT